MEEKIEELKNEYDRIEIEIIDRQKEYRELEKGIEELTDIISETINMYKIHMNINYEEDMESEDMKEMKEEIEDELGFRFEEYNERTMKLMKIVNREIKKINENILYIREKQIDIRQLEDEMKKLQLFIQGYLINIDRVSIGKELEEMQILLLEIKKKLMKNKNENIDIILFYKHEIERSYKILNVIYENIKNQTFMSNNLCGICVKERVDKYYNVCGHTICKECVERYSTYNEYQNKKIYKCPYCRIYSETKNLYYS